MKDAIALLTEDPSFDKEVDEYDSIPRPIEQWFFVGHLKFKLANSYAGKGFRLGHIRHSTMGVPDIPNHYFKQFKKDDVILFPLDTMFRSVNDSHDDVTGEDCLFMYGVEIGRPTPILKLENAKPEEIRDDIARGIYRDFTALGRGEFVDRHFSNSAVPIRNTEEMLSFAEKYAAELLAHREECGLNGHRNPVFYPTSSRIFTPYEEGQCTYCLTELRRPRRDMQPFAATI